MKRVAWRFPNMDLDFLIEELGDEAEPSHAGAAYPVIGPDAETSDPATAVPEPIPEPGVTENAPTSPAALPRKLIASFYQHAVVQRRVTNPFEENQIVGITNYIDFGFELVTRINGDKSWESVDESSFQLAASWQANKNFLLKGKMGPSSSSIALAFKSWWRPSFTFSITAMNDRLHGTTSYGFGIRVEDLREPSYQRADPNYVMLTPNKEHLAEGVLRNFGKRPMFQKDIDSGNFDHLPRELKPIGKIF